MKDYYKQFEKCKQNEKPFCTDNCPFNLDVIDFIEKMRTKRYNAAYKTFRAAVAFPEIVAKMCSEYCSNYCPRKEIDGSVQVNLLEKTCLRKAKRKDPADYNLPEKKKRIAVIGGGISGLACALRLAAKKFSVTIHEKSEKIGGNLWEQMPSELFLEDIKRQFKYENYNIVLNKKIDDFAQLEDELYDAVFVATGKNGNDFGLLNGNKSSCTKIGECGVFLGGSLMGLDKMNSIANGLSVAWAIEVFLNTGKLEYPKNNEKSQVMVDKNTVKRINAVIPTENDVFSEEELVEEASRCIKCQCNGCKQYCDLVDYTGKWPLKMRDEILITTMASESLVHKTPAIRMLNMCTQCGLCEEVCPSEIQLGDMIKEARRKTHMQKKIPGAFHQFWLNDMEHANGKYASLVRTADNEETCKMVFFPGCYLGAKNPSYVINSYEALLKIDKTIGIMLRCCGIPADWAGDENLHREEIANIKAQWESLGKPKLIMACSSCIKHFNEYLPEIKTISLYEVFNNANIDFGISLSEKKIYTIFDPCSARHNERSQQAVRNLLKKNNVEIEDIELKEKQGCCGFGGQGAIANPDFTNYVANKRLELSDNPYIVYCINCKDVFVGQGKECLHILDVLFSIKSEEPTETQRRINRTNLKEKLLETIWGEKMKEKPQSNKYKLIIIDAVQKKLNENKILEEDICYVLDAGEKYKRRVYDSEKGTYKCYRELGHITCWVEYKTSGEFYEIINIYTHRMKIQLEGIWNGKKADINL